MPYEEVPIVDPSLEAAEATVLPEMAQRIDAITDLATQAGEWTAQNGPAVYTKEVDGHKVEFHNGLRLADFRNYAARHMPGADDHTLDVRAALLQSDITRYLHPEEFKDTPPATYESMSDLLGKGLVASTAVFAPGAVMRYSVHKIKETGVPFEGSEAEQRIGAAIDAEFAALGRAENPDTPMLKQQILEAV